ncbi:MULTISPECIES: LysR family transcriptional regulator [unclassified Serratia (in: enterobacteria)]|uniref:LysR family transcriptional regulator n=1 Tax=unclassified Serratia (in: enterobacteria) TaxID=2647522 RepID=UPI000468DECD|nr:MULTISPECIES: LysR family transcriptional regulator [unclassified Serratia (in: enterobacteria)]
MNQKLSEIQLGSLELFCLTAETGSFTAAATLAALTPAAVSRAVARLEARLGAKLLLRTTRSMRLTSEGEQYYLRCRQALNQLNDAEKQLAQEQELPAGLLTISVPTPYAHYRLLPRLPAFRRLYPEVTLDIHVSNHNVDLTAQGYDLAIRGNHLPDSELVARKLEDAALCVVAAPEYLAQYGTPTTPEELKHHECIQFELPGSGRLIPWEFMLFGQTVHLDIQGGVVCRDDFLSTLTLAKAGGGLMQVYRFTVATELAEGKLIEVLTDYDGVTRPFYMLTPYSRYQPSRLKALIQFLVGLTA